TLARLVQGGVERGEADGCAARPRGGPEGAPPQRAEDAVLDDVAELADGGVDAVEDGWIGPGQDVLEEGENPRPGSLAGEQVARQERDHPHPGERGTIAGDESQRRPQRAAMGGRRHAGRLARGRRERQRRRPRRGWMLVKR